MFMSSPAAVRFFNGFGCCYWWPSFTWRELTICQLLKLCLTQVVFTNRVLLKFEFQNLAFKMKDDLQTNVCFKKSFFFEADDTLTRFCPLLTTYCLLTSLLLYWGNSAYHCTVDIYSTLSCQHSYASLF